MRPMNNSKNKLKSKKKKKKKIGLLICANCTLRLRLALAEKTSFFYYLAYFYYYSQVLLYFLVLFIDPNVLFQLIFQFYLHYFQQKSFQFQLNKLFPNGHFIYSPYLKINLQVNCCIKWVIREANVATHVLAKRSLGNNSFGSFMWDWASLFCFVIKAEA